MTQDLRQEALAYHAEPVPGKISVELTTSAETQLDLALAYSPGVAEPCREIAADEANAYTYTGKGNLVDDKKKIKERKWIDKKKNTYKEINQ